MKNQQNIPLLRKLPILVLSLAIFILIISGGYFYSRYEKKIISQEKHNYLKSMADLKTSQIVQWRSERLADADVFAETFIRQKFQRWLYTQDSTLEKELLERFSLLKYYYKYEDVIIVSTGGKFLLGLNANLKHLDSEIIEYCQKALREKKSFLSDFYFSQADHTIHFDVFAPILSDKNVPVALLVLRVNPFEFLYPLIQSWPTSSKSAETLIVRKDGDSVLYVNELRHISNTALKLRIPLSSNDVPAVLAVMGHTGIIEGTDYRGVRVLADLRPVPGSPWFMIAKVDQNEIFSELKYRTVIIVIIAVLMLLFSGIGISWFYNNRQNNIYRKLLETGAALREEKDRLRTILDLVGDPIFVTDNDHRIILANRAFYDLFYLDENSVIGFTLAEAVPESERQHFLDVDRRVLDGGIPDIREEELTVRNLTRTIIASKTCYTDESGKRFLVGSIHDITDRKLAEEALKSSEEKFSAAFRTSPYAITITNPEDGKFIEVNDAFYTMTGFTPEETLNNSSIGMGLWVDTEDRKSVLMVLHGGGKVADQEFQFRKKNGEIITGLFSAHLTGIKNKTYILSSFIDITEQKRMVDALKDSELKFREIVTFLDEGYYSVTLEGILLDHNRAFGRILGFDETMDLRGRKLPDFWQNPDERIDYLEAFGTEGVINNYTIKAKKQNGEHITVFASAHIVYNKDNSPLRIDGVFLDITYRIQNEEEILNQNIELKRFNNTMVDREIKMMQLKKEINEYCRILNLQDKYSLPEDFK